MIKSIKKGILNVWFDLAGSSWECCILFRVRNAKLEEATISPVWTPRVLDKPVAFAFCVMFNASIAYHCYCVIHLTLSLMRTSAIFFSQDTVWVTHKASWIRVHSNTHWPNRYQLLKSIVINVILFQLVSIVESVNIVYLVAIFFPRQVFVRVVRLLNKTLVLRELVSIEHPAASTAKVNFITVD